MTADKFFDNLIDKLKVWGLFAMLILAPICYTAGDLRVFQERVMTLSIMSYASLFFGCIWITLFFALNVALFLWNGMDVGSTQVFNIFICSILFAISRTFFSLNKIDVIFNALKVLLLISLSWGILQLLSIDPVFIGRDPTGQIVHNKSFNLFCGAFSLPACHGMFLALCLPFFLSLGWLIPILLIIPIYLCNSAAVYLTASAMFIYGFLYIRMVTFRNKIFYYIILSLLALGGIAGIFYDYNRDPLTGRSRFENWHTYIKYSLARPIFGWGPDSFRNLTPNKRFLFFSDEDYNPIVMQYNSADSATARYMSADEGKRIERYRDRTPKSLSEWHEAHNEYIQIFFEYGIVGLLIIGLFLKEICGRFRLSIDSIDVRILFGAILCYLIFSITQFPFHLARLAFFFPVILGAFFAKTDKDWDTFVKGGPYV
jgi:hypothetical protein